jgi:hypothetical protein
VELLNHHSARLVTRAELLIAILYAAWYCQSIRLIVFCWLRFF